jgi:disulfide bond formation protein DsbB
MVAEIGFSSSGRETRNRAMNRRGASRVDASLGAIALACIGAVAAALVSQHKFGMDPCVWCVLQRVIFLAIAAAAIVGLVWRRRAGRAIAGVLGFVLALAGAAAALWQHYVAAVSPSCNLTLADKIINALGLPALLPDVFEPRASCADAAVNLFGVSYDFWSLALFGLLALASLAVLAGSRTAHR